MTEASNAVCVAVSPLQAKAEALQAFVLHHLVDTRAIHLRGHVITLPGFLTLHNIMVILAAVVLAAVLVVVRRPKGDVPSGPAGVLEAFAIFIRDEIAIRHLGEEDGRRMTPLFCTLFCFILTMNLLGLVPSFAAATADVSVTAALATVSLAVMTVGAMVKHGPIGFFKGLMPHGVPWPVLIILVPIELLGLFIKSFALTIRLFANILAGHIVLFFFVGLIFVFGLWGLPFFAMALMIYFLELGVAFLQAYIFTLLSAVFIGQQFQPQH